MQRNEEPDAFSDPPAKYRADRVLERAGVVLGVLQTLCWLSGFASIAIARCRGAWDVLEYRHPAGSPQENWAALGRSSWSFPRREAASTPTQNLRPRHQEWARLGALS